MQSKLAPYQKASLMSLGMSGTGIIAGNPLLLPSSLAAHVAEKEYLALETFKIKAACGLTDAQWELDLPELYPWMLKEGRKMARVKALLEDVFLLDNCFSLNAVHLGVMTDLAKDIKELNFGYSNNWSYDMSHCGLSPFAVIGVSMVTASKWRHYADRLSQTSNLNLAEVALAKTLLDTLPMEYYGMIDLLERYVELLWHVAGERSGHYVLEVQGIAAELNMRQFIFESLDARQMADLHGLKTLLHNGN
jgi:hypothetical protein